MPEFSSDLADCARRAAKAYVSGKLMTRTTRQNPKPPRQYTIAEAAAKYHAGVSLTKKYVMLLKKGEPLPTDNAGGTLPALSEAEERALVTFIRSVEKSCFQVTEACIRNYASFIRSHRQHGEKGEVSQAWVRRFKQRHPELQCKAPKIKEISRAGAEMDIKHLELWFKELEVIVKELDIQAANFWNFDETPLQLGWVQSSPKLFSTRMKRNTKAVMFQPGNKESMTSVDAISAAGHAIPSFLILTAKVLLEEYTFAAVNDQVVLTQTDTGFNNSKRALQWLQHFNKHSFAKSESFKGFTLKQWFGYSSRITRSSWSEDKALTPSKMTRTGPPVMRLLIMDSFSAHEDAEFIWYCLLFDIIPFRLPSHTSHLLQPLDVGVYQHLKRAQRKSLNNFIASGGTTLTRYHFLNLWDELYEAAFRPCYIYVGFEKTGLWPLKPEVVLHPLRQARRDLEEPLFPKLIEQGNVTPRKAKRDLDDIQRKRKLDVLSSPTRARIDDVAACLDLAIITQSAHKEAIKLQQKRLQDESRRGKTRRRIGVGDGAYTIAELRDKVQTRSTDDRDKYIKKQGRAQEELFRQLRQEEAKKEAINTTQQPRLRGHAAVAAKAAKQQEDAVKLEYIRKLLPEDIEMAQSYQKIFVESTDEATKELLWSTSPKTLLELIPEVRIWHRNRSLVTADNEADNTADDKADDGGPVVEDFLPISSSPSLPPLRDDDDYDSDEVDILVKPSILGSQRPTLNVERRPGLGFLSDQAEEAGFDNRLGHRLPNHYSSDVEAEASLVIGSQEIRVPNGRRRPAGTTSTTTNSEPGGEN